MRSGVRQVTATNHSRMVDCKGMTNAWIYAALAFLLLAAIVAAPAVFAQDEVGGVIIERNAGPYQLLIAENPSNLSMGRLEVSVTVLNAAAGEPVPDPVVIIRTKYQATGIGGFAFAVNLVSLTSYDAQIELPKQGTWDITV